jgi:hypothetical protein
LWSPRKISAKPEGSGARPLRRIAERTFQDAPVEAVAVQVIHHLLALHDRQPPSDELAQAVSALQAVTGDLEMLSIFPAAKRPAILRSLPPKTRRPMINELVRRAEPRG